MAGICGAKASSLFSTSTCVERFIELELFVFSWEEIWGVAEVGVVVVLIIAPTVLDEIKFSFNCIVDGSIITSLLTIGKLFVVAVANASLLIKVGDLLVGVVTVDVGVFEVVVVGVVELVVDDEPNICCCWLPFVLVGPVCALIDDDTFDDSGFWNRFADDVLIVLLVLLFVVDVVIIVVVGIFSLFTSFDWFDEDEEDEDEETAAGVPTVPAVVVEDTFCCWIILLLLFVLVIFVFVVFSLLFIILELLLESFAGKILFSIIFVCAFSLLSLVAIGAGICACWWWW